MRNVALPEDIRGKCTALLQLYDATNSEWQLGKTKVKLQRKNTHSTKPPKDAARFHVLCYCQPVVFNLRKRLIL